MGGKKGSHQVRKGEAGEPSGNRVKGKGRSDKVTECEEWTK